MTFTAEQRQRLIKESKGKVIKDLIWEPGGGYWVLVFTDGSETCIRFMAELV